MRISGYFHFHSSKTRNGELVMIVSIKIEKTDIIYNISKYIFSRNE